MKHGLIRSVKKNFRKKGLATELRLQMLETLQGRGIIKFYGGTQVSNIAALKLARSLGYTGIADIQYLKIGLWKKRYLRRYRV